MCQIGEDVDGHKVKNNDSILDVEAALKLLTVKLTITVTS